MKKRLITLLAVALLAVAALATQATGSAVAADYVAMGDSYSSGNGTKSPNLSLLCYRSSQAYPAIVAKQRGFRLRFVACGGATTRDVLNFQVSSLNSKTAYATITIGGNDVGFANGVLTCPSAGESAQCWNALSDASTKIDTILPAALDKTYAEIKRRAPKAKVVVLGYGLYAESLCSATAGVTEAEAAKMRELGWKLDAKTAQRVALAGANFTYVNAINPFTPHGPCSSAPWINGQTGDLLNDWHPNVAGHRDGYAPLVRQVIG